MQRPFAYSNSVMQKIFMKILFPKLQAGGGYELLRTSQQSNRSLEVIPPPSSGYTVTYLKGIIGQAKVYIRPLQSDLDTSLVEEDVVSE